MDDSTLLEHAVSTPYPLTPMQSGMLLDGLRGAQDGVYVQQLIATLHEPLNVSLFRDAWQRLVEHHAVLRTSFHIEERDPPFQKVHPRINWEMEVSDCRDVGTVAGEQQIAAYVRNEQRRGFGLENPPLWRLRLFSLNECDHRLVWTSHHALLDGRSRVILLRDLFALYDALLHGNPLSLESPQPFEDHVRQLTNRDFRSSKQYWQQVLSGFCSTTRLAQSIPGSVSDDEDQYRTLEIQLTEGVTQSLASVAQEFDVTLNTILQGAWASILSLYSGTDDVVFGATRACRRTSVNGADSMVGLFINTLPVRARLRGSASLKEWLQELRAQWVAMRDHEQTPLTLVRQWSDVPADESLFESIVVFEKFSLQDSLRVGSGHWGNRSFRLLGNTNYPLIVAGYGGSRLRIELTYDRRRIADDIVLGIQKRMQIWLEEVASNPGRTLAEVPIISPREKQQLVSDGNATATVIPRHGSVAHLFESQAASTPEAVALAFSNGQWKYAELNDRANRLARRLRALGVGLETPVAVCAERSPEMVAGILGILKAGGAYVPVDPTTPSERILFMLGDTKAPVLLTQRSLLSELPIDGIDVVCLDDRETFFDDRENVDDRAEVDLPCPATFDSIAYIMFTSGSTGIPKGVAVPHRGIIRLVFGVDYVTLDSSRNILHLASPAFDASTFELWAALLHGGRCVLFPGRFPDLDVLNRVLCENEVDTLFLTTALFHTIVDESVTILSGVQQLLVGGEVLSVNHVRRALSCLPGVSMINGYGPTETTTFAMSYRIPRNVADDADSLPIGRPIGNTSIYVLDTLGRLVPAGVAGELYIGGPGVARGYWNQPELTAEKFVANPFSDDSESRLYRTGDLCRWRADGNLEFLGRMDGQVKLRGFRIELGEIESVLNEYPDVAQSVVILREDHPDDKRLVAYCVPTTEIVLNHSELRGRLRSRLPDYMLPSAFVSLDKLPLTSSGKVNRRGLPAPDDSRPDLETHYAAPRTPIEQQLASIWADVLGIEAIGIHDNFFSLGGHSLLVTRVNARISSELQVDLPLRKLFEAPTIAELSSEIEILRSGGLTQTVAAFGSPHIGEQPLRPVPVPRDRALPQSSSQFLWWDLFRQFPETSFNVSRAYRLQGPLDAGVLKEALQKLVTRHESLRTMFAEVDGVPVQFVGDAGCQDLPLVDLSRIPEATRLEVARQYFVEAAQYRYNLSKDRIMRSLLLRLHQQDHVLVLNFHHIIMDGWSLDILHRDLSALYHALLTDTRVQLPDLPIQPADFADWEQRFFLGQSAQQQVAFWKKHLIGAPSPPCLPGDGPGAELGDFQSRRQSIVLDPPLVDSLRRLAREERGALSMVFSAALRVMLYESTGHDDILLLTPWNGRTQPEIADVIGCFRKRMLVRSDLSGRPTLREILGRVWEASTGVYVNQDIAMQTVFPEWSLNHETSINAPVNLNFLSNMGQQSLRLSNLAVSSLTLPDDYILSINSPLGFVVIERERDILVILYSRCRTYSPSKAWSYLEDFHSILRRLVAAPNQRLSGKTRSRKS
ncbi:MAG: amino acid adenylation domain-containing protein [Planctomycetota bacterium]